MAGCAHGLGAHADRRSGIVRCIVRCTSEDAKPPRRLCWKRRCRFESRAAALSELACAQAENCGARTGQCSFRADQNRARRKHRPSFSSHRATDTTMQRDGSAWAHVTASVDQRAASTTTTRAVLESVALRRGWPVLQGRSGAYGQPSACRVLLEILWGPKRLQMRFAWVESELESSCVSGVFLKIPQVQFAHNDSLRRKKANSDPKPTCARVRRPTLPTHSSFFSCPAGTFGYEPPPSFSNATSNQSEITFAVGDVASCRCR